MSIEQEVWENWPLPEPAENTTSPEEWEEIERRDEESGPCLHKYGTRGGICDSCGAEV